MGYGAANVLKCATHGLLYVEECSACLQSERDFQQARIVILDALLLDLSNTLTAIADPDDYEAGGEKTAETCRRLAAECVALNDL